MALAQQVATHPAAVLIVGETGSGKEMVARAIHQHSLRCNNPWVDVNCAAIPEHLVESELFGYEKGAFSGAETQKPGLFEMADQGTLFLDEIGDLDAKVQVKLLRVLDGVPYYRLGGSKKVKVDVRIVAATNQDLEALAHTGKFRRDLYHRLAQFKLEIPPLRERPEDLLGIAQQVLHQHCPEARFTSDAVEAMLAYGWPGNVRELRNSVFRAVMLAKDPQREITAADLKLQYTPADSLTNAPLTRDLDHFERQKVLGALERCGGKQGKAAEELGISRRTLLRKLKAYREEQAEAPVATICQEQQRYYRAELNWPATIVSGSEILEVRLLNISVGGAAVAIPTLLPPGGVVKLLFTLPDKTTSAEIPGRIAWSNTDGEHG
ncbi:MAG: sigma 54-interacting transcriptional regulator, partial [Candidatus Angelobacter sp.]